MPMFIAQPRSSPRFRFSMMASMSYLCGENSDVLSQNSGKLFPSNASARERLMAPNLVVGFLLCRLGGMKSGS